MKWMPRTIGKEGFLVNLSRLGNHYWSMKKKDFNKIFILLSVKIM